MNVRSRSTTLFLLVSALISKERSKIKFIDLS